MSVSLPRGSRSRPLPRRFASGAAVLAVIAPVVGDRLLLVALPSGGIAWVRS